MRRIPLVLSFLILFASCRPAPWSKDTREFLAMGGVPVHVTVWGVAPDRLDALTATIRDDVARQEGRMSRFKPESVVRRLSGAGGAPVEVDPDTATVLEAALEAARETGGAFDPTVAPILEAWSRAQKDGRDPSEADLAAARARVGWDRVRIERRGDGTATVRIDAGMSLDLGGIAKGYFADLGIARLREAGVRRGLVELGGDLAAWDDRDRPEPFRVGIQHPFRRGEVLGVVSLDRGGIVTSGDYERGYDVGGRRRNHIVDPRTGQPCEGVHSVTVQAPDGMRADALATGILVLGVDDGLALARRTPGVDALIVADDPATPGAWKVHGTPGLLSRYDGPLSGSR